MSMSGRRPTRHIHGDVRHNQKKEKNSDSSFEQEMSAKLDLKIELSFRKKKNSNLQKQNELTLGLEKSQEPKKEMILLKI